MNFFQTVGNIIKDYYLWILEGVGYTLLVSLIGTVIGLVIGIFVGWFKTMPAPKNKAARVFKKIGDWILSAYVEIFRGTPMMVQAMVIFWGFALLNNGQTLNVIFSGLLIVSINTGGNNIKDTSVLNVIGFTELYFQANSIVAATYQTFATYLLVAVIYFILTFTITRVLRLIERKLDGKKNYVVLGSQNMDAESFLRENALAGGHHE